MLRCRYSDIVAWWVLILPNLADRMDREVLSLLSLKAEFLEYFHFERVHFVAVFVAGKVETAVGKEMRDSCVRRNMQVARFARGFSHIQKNLPLIF